MGYRPGFLLGYLHWEKPGPFQLYLLWFIQGFLPGFHPELFQEFESRLWLGSLHVLLLDFFFKNSLIEFAGFLSIILPLFPLGINPGMSFWDFFWEFLPGFLKRLPSVVLPGFLCDFSLGNFNRDSFIDYFRGSFKDLFQDSFQNSSRILAPGIPLKDFFWNLEILSGISPGILQEILLAIPVGTSLGISSMILSGFLMGFYQVFLQDSLRDFSRDSPRTGWLDQIHIKRTVLAVFVHIFLK